LSTFCSIADHLSPPAPSDLKFGAAVFIVRPAYLLKAFTGGFWGKLFAFSLCLVDENVSYTIT
jgi:DNA-directed RNA polymerase specialized sigma24 family protein